MTVRKALLLWPVFYFCCVCLSHGSESPSATQFHKYSFEERKSSIEFHDGVVGRVAVSFDSIEEGGDQTQAIITMDNLPDRGDIGILFIRVSLYLPECIGTPIAVIDYNSQSYNQSVAPQTFSVSKCACVQVDYYSRDDNEDLQKIDSFQLMLLK